jgi:hypothetical protein
LYKPDDVERKNPIGDAYNACFVGFTEKLVATGLPTWLRFKFLQNNRPNLKIKFLMDVYSIFSAYLPEAKLFLAPQDLKVSKNQPYTDIYKTSDTTKYLCYEFLVNKDTNPVILFIFLNVIRMAQEHFHIWANKDVFRLKDVHKEMLTYTIDKGPNYTYNYGHLHVYPVKALTELDPATNMYLSSNNKLYTNHETLNKLVPNPIKDLKQFRVACDRWGRLFDFSFKEGKFLVNESEEKRIKALLHVLGKPIDKLTLQSYVEKKINIAYGGATETVANVLQQNVEVFMNTDRVILKEKQEKESSNVGTESASNEKITKKKKENKE